MEQIWVIETCVTCNIQWKITEAHQKNLQRSHNKHYCPNGHGQHYPDETEEDQLKKQLELKEKHIERLYEENKKRIEENQALQKKLKQSRKNNDFRIHVFDKSQQIAEISNVKIYQPIVEHLLSELPKKFDIREVEKTLYSYYHKQLCRDISKLSTVKYAWSYKTYLVQSKKITAIGDGMYVKGDSKNESPPLPADFSDIEQWLIKKLPRKPFKVADFLKDYPNTDEKQMNKSISKLIKRRILTQLANDKLRLNHVERIT